MEAIWFESCSSEEADSDCDELLEWPEEEKTDFSKKLNALRYSYKRPILYIAKVGMYL